MEKLKWEWEVCYFTRLGSWHLFKNGKMLAAITELGSTNYCDQNLKQGKFLVQIYDKGTDQEIYPTLKKAKLAAVSAVIDLIKQDLAAFDGLWFDTYNEEE